MKLFLLAALLLSLKTVFAVEVSTQEYRFRSSVKQNDSTSAYFNRIGAPLVRLAQREIPDCEENCTYPVILNQAGKVIKTYGVHSSLTVIATGRYQDIAYMQYRHTYSSSDTHTTESLLINHLGKLSPARPTVAAIARLIGPKGHIFAITQTGLYKNRQLILPVKGTLKYAHIANNPMGSIAVIAITKNNKVMISNTKKWLFSGIALPQHGDRNGVLSVYPSNENRLYFGVYKYVNVYNKGLMAGTADFVSGVLSTGWLINSAERNVGWDPDVFVHDQQVVIAAKDSSHHRRITFNVLEQDFAQIAKTENKPTHIEGYEEEQLLSFLVGAGVAHFNWNALSGVPEENEMEYDIGSSTYNALTFEGRIKDTQLTVSYLKNQAEPSGDFGKAATEILNILVDFDHLFSDSFGDSSSLRLSMSSGKGQGIYDYQKLSSSLSTGPSSQQGSFKSELERYSAKIMAERGVFIGLEYAQYTTPSAIGFSNSNKDIEYLTLDEQFGIQNYMLQLGYDEISYAKRYETQLSRFFVDGHIGLGASFYQISDEVERQVEAQTNKEINTTWSFVFDGELTLGYIWQQRFKSAYGMGYSFTCGYKARVNWNSPGQSDKQDDNIDDDELELEFNRYDIWHGPYASANIIF